MASEIYLNRFNKDMSEIPISNADWKSCVSKISELKLVNDNEGILNRIECYCKAINDWIPVFWIDSKGNGFMRQSGFFQYDESYEKAIGIAGNLNAIIWGEEGSILFEPNIGVLYDDCEPDEQPIITLDELADRKMYYKDDIKIAIQKLIKEKEDSMKNKSEFVNEEQLPINTSHISPKPHLEAKKKWWKFWK